MRLQKYIMLFVSLLGLSSFSTCAHAKNVNNNGLPDSRLSTQLDVAVAFQILDQNLFACSDYGSGFFNCHFKGGVPADGEIDIWLSDGNASISSLEISCHWFDFCEVDIDKIKGRITEWTELFLGQNKNFLSAKNLKFYDGLEDLPRNSRRIQAYCGAYTSTDGICFDTNGTVRLYPANNTPFINFISFLDDEPVDEEINETTNPEPAKKQTQVVFSNQYKNEFKDNARKKFKFLHPKQRIFLQLYTTDAGFYSGTIDGVWSMELSKGLFDLFASEHTHLFDESAQWSRSGIGFDVRDFYTELMDIYETSSDQYDIDARYLASLSDRKIWVSKEPNLDSLLALLRDVEYAQILSDNVHYYLHTDKFNISRENLELIQSQLNDQQRNFYCNGKSIPRNVQPGIFYDGSVVSSKCKVAVTHSSGDFGNVDCVYFRKKSGKTNFCVVQRLMDSGKILQVPFVLPVNANFDIYSFDQIRISINLKALTLGWSDNDYNYNKCLNISDITSAELIAETPVEFGESAGIRSHSLVPRLDDLTCPYNIIDLDGRDGQGRPLQQNWLKLRDLN